MLTITDRAIRSTVTPHAAERTGEGSWRVSWLAGRNLSAGQAQAAMLIVEAACDVDADCDPELCDEGFWSRLDAWAAQLRMPGPGRARPGRSGTSRGVNAKASSRGLLKQPGVPSVKARVAADASLPPQRW